MQLLIMRHGEAGWHSLDQERTLTETGRYQVAECAAQIAASPWRPVRIWSSPYIRARQTAAIVSEILNCPVEEKPFITPEDDPGLCLDALLEISIRRSCLSPICPWSVASQRCWLTGIVAAFLL